MSKTTRRPLSERDASTLRNALIVAAEAYDDHAKEFAQGEAFYAAMTPEELAEYLEPKHKEEDGKTFAILNPHPNAYKHLRKQFERQALDVRNLIRVLDGPEDADEGWIEVVTIRD